MTNERRQEIRAGVLVLVVGTAFFFTLLYVGMKELFATGSTYIAEFRSTGILKKGAPVRYDGVEIGRVVDIRWNKERRLAEVVLKIEETEILPDGFLAVIETEGFLGQAYILLTTLVDPPAFLLSRPDTTVEPGPDGIPRIAGMDPASYALLLAKGGEIAAKVNEVADTVGLITDAMYEYVGDPVTKARIKNFIANAESASGSFARTGANAEVITLGVRERLPILLDKAERTLAGAERATNEAADAVEAIRPDLEETAYNARVFTTGIAEAPWRIVWKDEKWSEDVRAGRAQVRSLRIDTPIPRADAEAEPPPRRRRTYFTSYDPAGDPSEY